MSQSSKPFLDYTDENFPVSLDIITGQDIYSTSPDYSESTAGKNTYSLSPDVHGFIQANDQFPLNTWSYEDNFLLSGLDESQKNQTPLSSETDGKTAKKSQRNTKRAIAKERAKTKQEITSTMKGIETKDLLEELDDQNLDNKGKRKQIQKMRNRISAQNSRDRKKAYTQQLEEINGRLVEENTQLLQEKDILMGEISKLQYSESQLIQEVQALKNNTCTNCRQTANQGFLLNNVDTEQNLIDYSAQPAVFSGLSSPILSRFPSGKGILSFLGFAAFVSCVVVMNINMTQNNEIALQGPAVPDFKETERILEKVDNGSIYDNSDDGSINTGQQNFPLVNPYIVQNIEPLKNYFNKNYELLFKQHLEMTPMLSARWGMMYDTFQPEEQQPEAQNALTMYKDPKVPNLRGRIPTVITQNLPVIDQTTGDETVTSTLFCPTAFEFESDPKVIGFPQGRVKDRSVVYNDRDSITTNSDLNLDKAEYLQLFVPKHRVANIDVRNMTYAYDSLVPTEENDNSMLEIWCKVFMVRELNTNL